MFVGFVGSANAYDIEDWRSDSVETRWPNGQIKERMVQSTDPLGHGGTVNHGSYRSWYENGSLESQGEYWTGNRFGDWRYWYPDGGLREAGRYSTQGKQDTWVTYHSNGVLAEVTRYSYGKKLGLSELWDGNGMPTAVLRYSEDRLHGLCLWVDYEQNKSRQELFINDTLLVAFHRHGGPRESTATHPGDSTTKSTTSRSTGTEDVRTSASVA